MVIQRWQSVLLFLACVCMVIFLFLPFGATPDMQSPESFSPMMPIEHPVFFILNILAALLLLIDIFMFRNLNKQKMVLLVSMVLVVASEICVLIMTWNEPFQYEWYSSILLAAAFFLGWMAHSLMRRDQKTLASYDRIR